MIQCVDRKLKAADQLIYAEDDDMLHVAFIATNVNRSEHYLNHQYTLYESFKPRTIVFFDVFLYFYCIIIIQNINFRMLNFTPSVNFLRLQAELSGQDCFKKKWVFVL